MQLHYVLYANNSLWLAKLQAAVQPVRADWFPHEWQEGKVVLDFMGWVCTRFITAPMISDAV